MKVRPAEHEDIAACVAMGARFYDLTPWAQAVDFCRESFASLCERLIDGDDAALLVMGQPPVGMAACMLTPFYANQNAIMMVELFWWAEPEQRGQGIALLQAMEDWARTHDTHLIFASSTANLRERAVNRLYERRGYRVVDHCYLKDLAS